MARPFDGQIAREPKDPSDRKQDTEKETDMSTTRKTMMGAGLVAVMALALPATGAMARGGPEGGFGPAMLDFGDLDLNGDGQLTKDELSKQAEARFAKVDTDGDGQLDATELKAAASERQSLMVARMIQRLDEDGNGTLSATEMQAARDMGRGHRMKRGERGDHARGERGGKRWGRDRGEDRREARLDRMFERVDANGDGVISEEEFNTIKDHMARRNAPRDD